jgi:hypothetical protein
MKKLYPLFAIILFAIGIHAQNGNAITANTSTDSKSKDTAEVKVEPKAGFPAAVFAEKARPVTIPKISTPITVDGKADEESWKSAAAFKDFYQTYPGDNTAPSKPTEAYMMYDEKHLYVFFKCFDERDKIRATVAKRDAIFGEDNVRMWLDTYNDQRRAYVLGFNPFGIQQDGVYTEGQGADFSVDIVMESKGVIEEWGWSVEIKIPFKSLRYAAGKGKLWGFNMARNIDRFNDEFDQWLPDDRNVSGFLIKHGKITGLDGIKWERTLEIAPSITLSETGSRKRTVPISTARSNGYDPLFNPLGVQDPGRWVDDPAKYDVGVNVKYTITPNITLDAAINPDYAEIEADAPVVTANQRFPIFFQEKRPFFLEGKEIFDSPLQPFYSRTIVDPDIAVKLTGKINKYTFGFLAASDNAPGNYSEDERGDPNVLPRILPFLDKNALFGVVRVKRDIGKENSIGFFGTARTFPFNSNYVAGFDGKFKLDPKTVMTFQVLGTNSNKSFYNPDLDRNEYRTGKGFGYFWNLDYTADTHGWYLEALGRTKDYRADSGFTRRVDTNAVFFANRISTKSRPKAAMIRLNWQQFTRTTFDWRGRVQNAFVGTGFDASFQGNLFINGETGVQYEKIYEDEFGRRRSTPGGPGGFFGAPARDAFQPYFNINVNKNVSKKLFVYGFVGMFWNSFDYDFGAGDRFRRASPAFQNYLAGPVYANYLTRYYLNQTNPLIEVPDPEIPALDPGTGLAVDLNVGFEYKPIDPLRFSVDYSKSFLKRNDTGLDAFDTNIVTIRSTYQFSRFTYVRARWDYDSLSSHVGGQFLFGWNPNPGTAFYVGYNDDFNYNGFNPFTGQSEVRFERNSRTFFIRASYLFRKSF